MQTTFWTALLTSLAAAAASTPVGVLVSWPMVSAIDPPTLGLLLALSAGALVYVGATHLLPRRSRSIADTASSR